MTKSDIMSRAEILFKQLELAVKALEHIARKDLACSPCNGRGDYDVCEHHREKAKKALTAIKRAQRPIPAGKR